MTAWMLLQTETGTAAAVLGALATMTGVRMADTIAGAYDVIVSLAGTDADTLSPQIDAVSHVPGVRRSITCRVAH
jgi:hypothetical protein